MAQKKKTGRPKLKIDAKQVEALASYGCTNTEIASFFGCERTTITKRFSRFIAKGKDSGKIRLRQKQFDVAMKGNVTMLIWLGKQILDQVDKQEHAVTGEEGGPIQIEYVLVKAKKQKEGGDGKGEGK